ncbi:MAG: ABC transporter substrate-binding protein [Actinomycetaceae bacterium]
MRTRFIARSTIAVVAGALLLAACGSDDADGTSDGAGPDDPEGGASDAETTAVTVGVLPIVDVAPIYLAEDLGYFDEEGLDVTLEQGQGGAALIPAVISGEYEFGFSNFTSQVNAVSQNLPLLSVTPGVFTTGETGNDAAGVVAMPDSGIERAADLEGRTIATNTLANNFVMTVNNAVEEDGGDPDTVEWVEIAWPDMPAAVANVQVDAGVVVEPFVTQAEDAGAEVVLWHWVETDPNFLVAGYFTTDGYAEQNPDVVEAFVRAVDRGREYADENPDEVRRITGTYTELSDDLIERIRLPRYSGAFVLDELQEQADLAEQHGITAGHVDVADMLLNQ